MEQKAEEDHSRGRWGQVSKAHWSQDICLTQLVISQRVCATEPHKSTKLRSRPFDYRLLWAWTEVWELCMTSKAVCVLPAYLPPLFFSTKQPMRTSRVSKATAHIIPTNHSWGPPACLLDAARTKKRLFLEKCHSWAQSHWCQFENIDKYCLVGLEDKKQSYPQMAFLNTVPVATSDVGCQMRTIRTIYRPYTS